MLPSKKVFTSLSSEVVYKDVCFSLFFFFSKKPPKKHLEEHTQVSDDMGIFFSHIACLSFFINRKEHVILICFKRFYLFIYF